MKTNKSISRFILEKLAEVGELTLEGLFPENRVEGRIWRQVLGLPSGYEFSRETFSTTLSRLKKQGLVKKSGGRRKAVWSIIGQGKEKLNFGNYPFASIKTDGLPRLVMYDVPELERKKRDWLRYGLVACGYKQLQKSVWLGYCPLTEEFVKSLSDLGLKSRVHVVSIHKKGTLEEF
ncbi:MAG: hypothetical protein HY454_03870 [Parcubacteria group bacterium]|nr:hypothetical protein [Parcubacteria group bacterium]